MAFGDPTIYSNFDHELDTEVEADLKKNPLKRANHPAWNFHGQVWFDGAKWFNEVWRYRQHEKTFEGATAKEVIDQANAEFGCE